MRCDAKIMSSQQKSDGSPADARGKQAARRRLLGRLLGLGLRYRTACLWMVVLQTLLVGMSLAGLGLTGLGIDFIRSRVDPTSAPPAWPFGWTPPAGWSALEVVALVAAAVLCVALLNAALRYGAAIATADITQR